jgi:hypothetical protein
MKKLLKLAIASMMVIGAIAASAQDDKTKTAGQKYVESCARNFDNMSLVNPDGSISGGRAAIERPIIRPGESTRYKALFNSDHTSRIIIKGVAETTDADIRKGVWEVTLKPEKTTIYTIIEEFSRGGRLELDYAVIVVEAEKYDSIIELRSRMNSQQRGIHFRELKGEKVDPWEKEMVDKMAKMTPKERNKYKRSLSRKYGKSEK